MRHANLGEGEFDSRQDICMVSVSPYKSLIYYKWENSSYVVEKSDNTEDCKFLS